MKRFLLLLLLGGSGWARAQQPTIDPAFVPTRCYAPAAAKQAVQQADGKIVVLGNWLQAEGSPAGPLVRYLAGGTQLDAAFVVNTRALVGQVQQVLPLASGELLRVSQYGFGMRLGNVTRSVLLRLNADGTPDASFDVGTAANGGDYVHTVLEQANGKLVVGGNFTTLSGRPAAGLVRLNPDGSLDTAFLTAAAAVQFDGFYGVQAIVQQPDGKLLVRGLGMYTAGQRHFTICRLLPSGALDTTFDDRAGRGTLVSDITVQPDGQVLAVLPFASLPTADTLGGAPAGEPVRLEATGLRDASFQLAAGIHVPNRLPPQVSTDASSPLVRVHSDGRILLAGPKRLLANGSLDSSFAPDATVFPRIGFSTWMQLLPTGQVLLAGGLRHCGGPGSPAQSVALLSATGTREAGFVSSLQAIGRINAVTRQPDGKLLVGGFFDELNGQARSNVARLNYDGSLDASFNPAFIDDEVATLTLRADGKLLLGGNFLRVGTGGRVGLARLLPAGGLDAAFAPVLTFTPATYSYEVLKVVARVLALPGGQVLATGRFGAGSSNNIVRFDGATGQVDASFRVPASLAGTIAAAGDAALLPNGNVVAIVDPRTGQTLPPLVALLPSGSPDPAFTPVASPGFFGHILHTLAPDAAGRVYVGGVMYSSEFGDGQFAERLLPNGTLDPSFNSRYIGFGGPGRPPTVVVNKLLLQPNGRLLLGGKALLPLVPTAVQSPTGMAGSCRVLASGAVDTAYDPARGPGANVLDMLLEPDGAIVAAGTFTEVGTPGQVYHGLVRLRDTNVLAVATAQAGPATAAWPVPAHGQLHLALDAEAHPRQIQLLDALGRTVLTQAVATPNCLVNTAALPAGVYLLRVDYATGPVSRRVVLE